MRLKKGFTLAEILIVLMVIGVVATMTIPSLMRGVQDAQFKTGYKKAFNAVSNVTSMETISGNFVAAKSKNSVDVVYKALKTNLSVKDFATAPSPGTGATGINSGVALSLNNFSDIEPTGTNIATSGISPWITTEDNISYAVVETDTYRTWSGDNATRTCSGTGCPTQATGTGCGTKAAINAYGAAQACAVVLVDVNGVAGSPNILEPQLSQNSNPTTTSTLNQLKGDRFPIFIGTDGATAGSKKTTVTGRIVAELK